MKQTSVFRQILTRILTKSYFRLQYKLLHIILVEFILSSLDLPHQTVRLYRVLRGFQLEILPTGGQLLMDSHKLQMLDFKDQLVVLELAFKRDSLRQE